MGIVLQVANLKDIYLLVMDNGNKVHAASSREWSAKNKALKTDDHVRILILQIITYFLIFPCVHCTFLEIHI